MQRIPWRFVLQWQAVGMACTLVSAALLIVGETLVRGESIASGLANAAFGLIFIVAGTLIISPLSLIALVLWTALVRRSPGIERSMSTAASALALLAILQAVTAGVISNWEALISDYARQSFFRDTLAISGAVLPWSLIGIVMPRLLFRTLRPEALRRALHT